MPISGSGWKHLHFSLSLEMPMSIIHCFQQIRCEDLLPVCFISQLTKHLLVSIVYYDDRSQKKYTTDL